VADLFPIVHEDTGLLVINKPAGLVCHPTKGDALSSLISRVRLHLGAAGTPHLINRLDRETSGLVLVGKDSRSAFELRHVLESRRMVKDYWAIVYGSLQPDYRLIRAPLGKDPTSAVAIKDMVRPDGLTATTELWVNSRFVRGGAAFTWLRVRAHTGRKHQIRIHLSWIGHPLVGDKLYGPDEKLYLALVEGRLTAMDHARLVLPYHALHAVRVRLPWRGLVHEFTAKAEEWYLNFLPAESRAEPAPA
jgi:23S rRNA pseudouridine1911/1915/1917 synthase